MKKKIKLGNSRLLFAKQSVAAADINAALAAIDGFLATSSKSELARPEFFVYPEGESEVLIGREIAGFPGETGTNLQFKDFKAEIVWEQELKEEANTIADLINKAVEQCQKEGKRFFRLEMSLSQFIRPKVQMIGAPCPGE